MKPWLFSILLCLVLGCKKENNIEEIPYGFCIEMDSLITCDDNPNYNVEIGNFWPHTSIPWRVDAGKCIIFIHGEYKETKKSIHYNSDAVYYKNYQLSDSTRYISIEEDFTLLYATRDSAVGTFAFKLLVEAGDDTISLKGTFRLPTNY